MPAKLETLPSDATLDQVVAAIRRDGAVIVDRLMSGTQVDQLLAEARPFVERTGTGGDRFAG